MYSVEESGWLKLRVHIHPWDLRKQPQGREGEEAMAKHGVKATKKDQLDQKLPCKAH